MYRKKPVVIEAIQWDGTSNSSCEIYEWSEGEVFREVGALWIRTLEGTLEATPMDWIIKGVKGEFYPCKPDIFEATYEKVDIDPQDDA